MGDNSSSAMLASFSEMVASNAFCLKKIQNNYLHVKFTSKQGYQRKRNKVMRAYEPEVADRAGVDLRFQ